MPAPQGSESSEISLQLAEMSWTFSIGLIWQIYVLRVRTIKGFLGHVRHLRADQRGESAERREGVSLNRPLRPHETPADHPAHAEC